jgi:alpha-galactosidase
LSHRHDYATLGQAVHRALLDAYQALREEDPDVLIEFRQNYSNLAMRDCATMYRGFDTLEFDTNRWNITMTRAVSGGLPVHFDPAHWRPNERNENVARHMLNSVFSVPMLSVDFDRIPEDHVRIIRAWLDFYYRHKPLLTQGRFVPIMANGHLPAIHISSDGRAIFGLFGDALPEMNLSLDTRELLVLNGANRERVRLWWPGQGADFEGEVFDLFHRPCAKMRLRAQDSLVLDVPIGGYARLVRTT